MISIELSSTPTAKTPELYDKPLPATADSSPNVTENAPDVAEAEPASTSNPSPAFTVTPVISPPTFTQAEPL